MCAERACLALRLFGPMQSWGTESRFNRRDTALLPSKSALAGLICAALGARRGSPQEDAALRALRAMPLLVVAVPRFLPGHGGAQANAAGRGRPLIRRRLEDFHTVLGTKTAEGKKRAEAVLTWRQYLQDAAFLALFSGPASELDGMAEALRNPVWGLWLGRKSCIPSRPVFGGLFPDEATALAELLPVPLAGCAYARETGDFAQGTDSLPDQPLCFGMGRRAFAPRRVTFHEPEKGSEVDMWTALAGEEAADAQGAEWTEKTPSRLAPEA